MIQKGKRQAYKNFRLNYRSNWNIVERVYEDNVLVIIISRRMFWYNFESMRRVIIRAVRRKIRKRYKIQRKIREKTWSTYKRDYCYRKKLFWIGGLEWLPFTMKPRGSRMGHGKGRFKTWYVRFRPGIMIFKMQCWKLIVMYIILKRLSYCFRIIQLTNIKRVIYKSREELYW